MTQDQSRIIYMMIGALASHIQPEETTPAFDKFRRNIRKYMWKLSAILSKKKYLGLARSSNSAWEYAMEQMDKQNVKVSVSHLIDYLYFSIEDDGQFKSDIAGQSKVYKATRSIRAKGELESKGRERGSEKALEAEQVSYELATKFLEHIGIQRNHGGLKQIIERIKNEV